MQSITLSHFLSGVKTVIADSFKAPSWVTAEILSISSGAHRYLELVEYDGQRREIAKTRGVIWKSAASLVDTFKTATGNELQASMKVLIKVRPVFHESFGFQVVIEDLDPNYTVGEMQARIQAIRQFLKEKQVWGLNLKLSRPADYRRLAVIAPPDAAGLGDFRVESDRLNRLGICQFVYFTAAFQGENAGDLIVEAMGKAVEAHQAEPFDALIIIRGGGDKSGLYQLNHRRLAHAVCRTPMPVLIGIGHERDKLLLDEVANTRFATPSLVIAHVKEVIIRAANDAQADYDNLTRIATQVLDKAEQEAQALVSSLLSNAEAQLSLASERAQTHIDLLLSAADLQLEKAESMLARQFDEMMGNAQTALQVVMEDIDRDKEQLFVEAERQLDKADAENERLATEIMAANPLAILQRGYAYVKNSDGFVTSAEAAVAGDVVTVTLKNGSFNALVEAPSV